MIWLIITQNTVISFSTKTQKYYEHAFTNEIYRLVIMNPAYILSLLMQWYYGQKIQTITLALDGAPIIESFDSHKTPSGYLSYTQKTPHGIYTVSIPGYLIAHYTAIFLHYGIAIEMLTTCALLTYAAVHNFGHYNKQILMQGCLAYETICANSSAP